MEYKTSSNFFDSGYRLVDIGPGFLKLAKRGVDQQLALTAGLKPFDTVVGQKYLVGIHPGIDNEFIFDILAVAKDFQVYPRVHLFVNNTFVRGYISFPVALRPNKIVDRRSLAIDTFNGDLFTGFFKA